MEARKVVVVDAPNYFFTDQRHLLKLIREHFNTTPIYMCVNPENEYFKANQQRLLRAWSYFDVKVNLSRDVDLDVVNEVVKERQANKVVVASNDGRLLWKLTEDGVKPIYLRITYKSKKGKWVRPPYVLDRLKQHGYTVIDLKVANRIEGALAVVFGLEYEEVIRLWEARQKYERSVVLAREKVLPELPNEATYASFTALCEKKKVLYPLEALYFLAYKEVVKVRKQKNTIIIEK